MSSMIIGRGFDKERIFDGDIDRIEVKSGDCPKLRLYLKMLKHFKYETYFRILGNFVVFVLALTCWQRGRKNEIEKRIVRAVTEKRQLLLPLLLVVQALLMWRFEAYRSVVSGYVLLFVMGGVIYPLIVPTGVMRQRSIYVIWPVIGLVCLSILGGYLIGYSVNSIVISVVVCYVCRAAAGDKRSSQPKAIPFCRRNAKE